MGAVPVHRLVSPTLVGRVAELAELTGPRWPTRPAGPRRAVLVAGEAGIGKTRLVNELADRARDARRDGSDRALHRPRRHAACRTSPLLEALRSRRGAGPRGGRPARRTGSAGRGPATPTASGHGLFAAVFERLRRALDARPSPVAAGPARTCTGPTRRRWTSSATWPRGIRDRRMLLVATYRDDELPPGDPLSRLVVELVRAARRRRCSSCAPLSPAGGCGTCSSTGRAGRCRATSPTPIVARSGGNPFFAEELLAAAERGEAELPRLLRDALLQRVAAHRRRRPGRAAGWPRRSAATCRTGCSPRAGPLPEAACWRRRCAQAVEHGVLVPDHEAATYRFRHALLAEAVYATLLPGEREGLHERLAGLTTLTRPTGGRRPASWPGTGTRPAGRPRRSPRRCARPGTAEAVSGLAEALQHLERALAALARGAGAPPTLAGIDLPARPGAGGRAGRPDRAGPARRRARPPGHRPGRRRRRAGTRPACCTSGSAATCCRSATASAALAAVPPGGRAGAGRAAVGRAGPRC